MFDFANLANNDKNTSIFYSIGSGDLWQTWIKPKGCSFVNLFVLGSGAGGGAGHSSATQKSGGGGGGSGGHSKLIVPSFFLADVLYIKVGQGASGGLPAVGNGNSGATGELSYVSIMPNIINTNVILASGTLPATGGGGGIANGNSAGGTASTIFSISNGLLGYMTLFNTSAGAAGTNGGNVNQGGGNITVGSGGTFSLPSIVTGGVGGSGCSTAGGFSGSKNGTSIIGNGFVPTIRGGLIATLEEAENGYTSFNGNSIVNRNGLFFTGGAGGYANFSSTGGNGGNGAFGCGGGGGGGGTTGGRGGNGGDGLVIITWF
jgi:hypothetical protein